MFLWFSIFSRSRCFTQNLPEGFGFTGFCWCELFDVSTNQGVWTGIPMPDTGRFWKENMRYHIPAMWDTILSWIEVPFCSNLDVISADPRASLISLLMRLLRAKWWIIFWQLRPWVPDSSTLLPQQQKWIWQRGEQSRRPQAMRIL